MQQKWECDGERRSTGELNRYEGSKTKYLFQIGWLQECCFVAVVVVFSPNRNVWERIVVIVIILLSDLKGQEIKPLHLCFLPFLSLLSMLSACSSFQRSSVAPGKALSTQKHPWCNHIAIFPKANKQFCLSHHVLLIAKLSNLMGYMKLQSLQASYLFFFFTYRMHRNG